MGKATASWKAYVNYISDIVIAGFANSIVASLKYLRSQIDPESIAKQELRPLIRTELMLMTPEIVSQPDLGEKGVRGMIAKWLGRFMEVGNLMKRYDSKVGAI